MNMRLQYKVPLLILLVMLIIGLATGGVMIRLQRQAGEDEFKQMATGLAGVVQNSLQQDMLQADIMDDPATIHTHTTQPAVSHIGQEELVNDIIIYRDDCTVAASASGDTSEEPTSNKRVKDVIEFGDVTTELRHGHTELSVITPVRNQPECHGCHPTGDVLGAVEVTLDTGILAEHERQQAFIMALIGTVTFFLVGMAATYIVSKTLLSPLRDLGNSAERISTGDYTARAKVRSSDEVGKLARTFNEMAEKVGTRTQEIELLNQELEDRVLQRTKELFALNTVISVTSEPLDLDKILIDTLDRVLSFIDIDAGIVHLQGDKDSSCRAIYRGVRSEEMEQVSNIALEKCPVGQKILAGTCVNSNDHPGGGDTSTPEGREFQSRISIPIKSKGQVLGALCLFSHKPRQFDPKSIQLLETMGEAIGVSVENAQVAEKLGSANKKLSTLMEQAMQGGFNVKYDNPHLVNCWEEMSCQNTSCPCHHAEKGRCWQSVGTFCGNTIQCQFAEEMQSCANCKVYQQGCWHDNITAIGENFNNMMYLLEREAKRREQGQQQLLERIISAQEEERKRVARELHDETGQALTAVMMEVSKTMDTLPSNLEKTKAQMASVRTVTGEALANVRKLIFDLRPEVLDDLGLVPALRSYVKTRLTSGGIKATFNYRGGKQRLPSQVEILLFRVVQEAVTNIMRHSQATVAQVNLEVSNSKATVIIEDNGKGFDTKRAFSQADAWGLRGMQERVGLLGGTLFIDSAPGKGTIIHVEIPINDISAE